MRDGGDVVDGAEAVAEVVVGQVGQRAAVGLAARLELLVRDEQRGDEAAGRSGSTLMISAAVVSSLRVLRMRPVGLLGRVGRVALDQRHDRDAGLEAGQAERQLAGRRAGRPRPS